MAAISRGKTVCVFGAGGSVGAVVYAALKDRYRLRLTDARPVDAVVARGHNPLNPGWDTAPSRPHEWRVVDVTRYEQVAAALEGCDAAINLTVNRTVPTLAFRINAGGAFHVCKAAASLGVSRVIHTGPITRVHRYEGDYRYEYDIPDEAPIRPGTSLYEHTKYLGLEIVTAFAERTGLDVITLLLSRLRPGHEYDGRDDDIMISFSVAWEDLGEAFVKALQAPAMPRPNEIFFVCARLPFGKYHPDKAERLLGFKAEHTFEEFWRLPLKPR
jgi:nucleoside-diphosphate-sugar epimerase